MVKCHEVAPDILLEHHCESIFLVSRGSLCGYYKGDQIDDQGNRQGHQVRYC